jgi:hypothetical protein
MNYISDDVYKKKYLKYKNKYINLNLKNNMNEDIVGGRFWGLFGSDKKKVDNTIKEKEKVDYTINDKDAPLHVRFLNRLNQNETFKNFDQTIVEINIKFDSIDIDNNTIKYKKTSYPKRVMEETIYAFTLNDIPLNIEIKDKEKVIFTIKLKPKWESDIETSGNSFTLNQVNDNDTPLNIEIKDKEKVISTIKLKPKIDIIKWESDIETSGNSFTLNTPLNIKIKDDKKEVIDTIKLESDIETSGNFFTLNTPLNIEIKDDKKEVIDTIKLKPDWESDIETYGNSLHYILSRLISDTEIIKQKEL